MAGRPLRRLKNPEDTLVTLNRLGSKAIGMYLYEPRTGENWVVARRGSSIVVRNCSTGQATRDVSGLTFTKTNPRTRKNLGAASNADAIPQKTPKGWHKEDSETFVRFTRKVGGLRLVVQAAYRPLDVSAAIVANDTECTLCWLKPCPQTVLKAMKAIEGLAATMSRAVLKCLGGHEPEKANPCGCSCGGKCAPCASRKNRHRKAAR